MPSTKETITHTRWGEVKKKKSQKDKLEGSQKPPTSHTPIHSLLHSNVSSDIHRLLALLTFKLSGW